MNTPNIHPAKALVLLISFLVAVSFAYSVDTPSSNAELSSGRASKPGHKFTTPPQTQPHTKILASSLGFHGAFDGLKKIILGGILNSKRGFDERYQRRRRFKALTRFRGPRRNGFNQGVEQSDRTCRFLWDINNNENIYAITPESLNGGWAMSPDQQCTRGTWCPYACKPGYYSTQWDPDATRANGKGSMNGGLLCDKDGILQKPFPDKPYCARGLGNVVVNNTLPQPVSACQTVYPGNEAMIIPSTANPRGTVELNVVPKSYWLRTSCQFYVNLAGSTQRQCIWGTSSQPVGNWGPYIFGTGQGADGNTYVSVQYNPLYIQSGFSAKTTYNVRIACTSGSCNFPAANECKCEGGTCSMPNGCTVTLRQGARAQFVLY